MPRCPRPDFPSDMVYALPYVSLLVSVWMMGVRGGRLYGFRGLCQSVLLPVEVVFCTQRIQKKHWHSTYFPSLVESLVYRLFLLGKRCQVEGTETQIPTPKRALWCPPILPTALGPVLFWLYILFQRKINFFFCQQSGLGLLVRGLVSLMELRGGTGSRMEGISPW